MDGVRTLGHVAAQRAVAAMIQGRVPHALLLVGPAGVGKTTLALDLAAGLLCRAADPTARPCGACRACRLVASGGHPDLHRLGPDGPGRQVVIGGPGSRARGIRDLVTGLALMPVEGGARVAIIESAQRMNEDAQAALLKTLEEPPPGVTLILCADAEEPLLPTIRSRCARLRLGPVGARHIERILAGHGIDDPPLASRVALLAGGRPGLALAWAVDPGALRLRDELSRILLDLTGARPAERLSAIRAAAAGAGALADIAGSSSADGATVAGALAPRGRRPGARPAVAGSYPRDEPSPDAEATTGDPQPSAPDPDPDPTVEGEPGAAGVRTPAAERRRAAEAVVSVWADVARDLLLARRGVTTSLRDPRLLEEVVAVASGLDEVVLAAFLDRLGRAAVLIAGNVSPDLVLDDLALAWPRRIRPAA